MDGTKPAYTDTFEEQNPNFFHLHLLVNNFAGGGKTMKNFSFGAIALYPSRRNVSVLTNSESFLLRAIVSETMHVFYMKHIYKTEGVKFMESIRS